MQTDGDSRKNEGLSDRERELIRQEEIFREEIRAQLATPQTWRQRLWHLAIRHSRYGF